MFKNCNRKLNAWKYILDKLYRYSNYCWKKVQHILLYYHDMTELIIGQLGDDATLINLVRNPMEGWVIYTLVYIREKCYLDC